MASSKSPVGGDRGRQPGGAGQQPRPGLLPRRAGRPSSTWSSTTWPSGRASSTRCASGRACCTGSRRGWPRRRCTRSGCRPARRDWVETVQLYFPRWGRTADELCVTELGSVIWAVQMSTVEFHPWNSRRADTEKPDEWRIDLDPGDECDYATVQRVAHVVHEVLDELGAVGFPKTSGGKGHARLRADPPRARLQGRTPWGAGLRPRDRAADARTTSPPPGGARTATLASSSSTTTRTPATTPSPRRTRSAVSPTPGSRRRSPGTEVDDADPRDFTIFTGPERSRARRPARSSGRAEEGCGAVPVGLDPWLSSTSREASAVSEHWSPSGRAANDYEIKLVKLKGESWARPRGHRRAVPVIEAT